jgi:OmpA-OmpF porin, OOP family
MSRTGQAVAANGRSLVMPVLLVLVACAGCAGARLRERVDALGGAIAEARARGAESCAPVALAMAESHHEFAGLELDEGDYYRARAEFAIADESAREVARLSRGACARGQPGVDSDGDGVADDRDECPDRAEDRDGVEDADGCPDEDDDGDKLVGAADKCPAEAEDRDGFADEDGCPELDNDQDKLADRDDQCPDQAEDADGNQDRDGCPDCDDDGDGVVECPEMRDRCPGQPGRAPDGCPYAGVVVTDQRIEIRQPIEFAPGRAAIAPSSHELLAEVARVLAENPALRVRVEGHTDSQGGARKNLRISRARAEAVRRHLIARGIDKNRIVSQGYGEEKPVADNRTAAGRAQNRRVEFVITGR